MPQQHLPPNWQARLLATLNARGWILDDLTSQPFRLLTAWQRCEGGDAKWNPLNTTYSLVGATNYNDHGVKNYRWPIDGICATALTICTRERDGTLRYGGILGALQSGGKTAEQIVVDNADEFRTWGTNPNLMLEVLEEL